MQQKTKQAVYEKQVGLIYHSLPFSLLTTAVVAALLFWFLRNSVDQRALVTWAVLMGGVLFLRSVIAGFYFFQAKQGSVNFRLYDILFAVGIMLVGACWGSAGIWLYALADQGSRFLIMVVLIGLSAGSFGLLAYRLPMFLLYINFILLPFIVGVNLVEESQKISVSLAIVVYIFFLSASARRFSGNTKKMLILQEEAVSRENNLKEAWKEAERASQAKSDFLANVSHEIRTPMNSIIGLNRILAMETDLTPQQLYYTKTIQNSADSLLGLLNNVLDLAKVEAGQLTLESHPFVLQKIVDEAVQTVQLMAEEKGLELSCSYDPQLPEVVEGDSLRLRQILLNLLSNGVKFTERGGVAVRVCADKQEVNSLSFAVEDSGIGIAPDKMDHIFDSFSQADSSVTRKYGGSGMGLAICKKLCTLMGGSIDVKSVLGHGSTFVLSLVLPPVVGSQLEGNGVSAQGKTEVLTGLNILLVEDNKVNRDVARLFLAHDGHHVSEAVNGLQALQVLAEKSFDVILMDIQMPVMDGIETSRIIRSCERGDKEMSSDIPDGLAARLLGSYVPIIALTAHAMDSDMRQCLDIGMDAYLTKPLQPSLLNQTLADVMDPGKPKIQINKAKSVVEVTEKSLRQQIADHLSTVYHISPDRVEGLVTSSLETLSEQLDDCRQSIDDGDLSTFPRKAHTLKGSLLNFGFDILGARLQQLEKDADQGIEKDYHQEFAEIEQELSELFQRNKA